MTGRALRLGLAGMAVVAALAACSAQSAQETAAPTTAPSTAPTPAVAATLSVTGAEETVFDWSSDSCEPENIPDLAARAFRDDRDQVHLLISHYINYQMTGPDLDHLTPDCTPILTSTYDPDPAQYRDAEWLASPYTNDGKTVFALVHDEYHGWTHPGQCSSADTAACLDTAQTMFVSRDSGRTYTPVSPPPSNLVSATPYVYFPDRGPSGSRTPSNIIRGEDGFYYVYTNTYKWGTQVQGTCLLRTDNLEDSGSWRFWNGTGFEGISINPYVDPLNNRTEHMCTRLAVNDIGTLGDSITYNTYLGQYVLVGLSADQVDGREVWGIYYSFTRDLIHFTHRQLLVEMPLPWTVADSGKDASILYPTLLDPASESANFSTTGQTAYLYYTRHNAGQGSLDRDLIRVPVQFSATN